MPSDNEAFDAIAYINRPEWTSSRYGLERITELLSALGNPQDRLKFVHVAGTNGKGSICAYLDSVLRASGYRTGLFTSPYIERFEERLRIDGCDIPADALNEVTRQVRDAAENMADHPTTFELLWAVAVLWFARNKCDIVVAEVGLGGRYDATNSIEHPQACVIARIGLDHTDLLGDTLALIAREKAGIIKPSCPVVSHPQDDEALAVIRAVAGEQGCEMRVPDFTALATDDSLTLDAGGATKMTPRRAFTYKGEEFSTKLLGSYQPGNAATAIETLRLLAERGWHITDEAIRTGIAEATWPGRFEVVSAHPLFIIDGGHNPQGADAMAATLHDILPQTRPVFLIGILADKDYGEMLRVVAPFAGAFVTITPDNPRALSAQDLAREIGKLGRNVPVIAARDIDDGIAQAVTLAGERGAVCSFGSLYSVGAVKAALKRRGIGV